MSIFQVYAQRPWSLPAVFCISAVGYLLQLSAVSGFSPWKSKELAEIIVIFFPPPATNDHNHMAGNSSWHTFINGGFLFFYSNISLSEFVFLSKPLSQPQIWKT